ncbi:YggT family protein [Bradyrhizobium sp. SSBR45G]|uniref:YggT family protein n=1 Tax=unclassified Bradyrhizobium TaxID=2631580 RepID=UPI002342BD11|nr:MULTISPECIES: YggT family protein [unclassified Bradyrhizobium]GLH76971.1 YggT family protein [Bradyrhizobium sp. SSBR45G]GLH83729.1 YggT family protein [Bradyrhizobium sp. SSBR45R]
MQPIVIVLILVIQFYRYLLIAAAIFSWLVAFDVVNMRSRAVATIGDFLYRITEPALGPIRRRLPNLGGLDISPIILFFLLLLIEMYLERYVLPFVP